MSSTTFSTTTTTHRHAAPTTSVLARLRQRVADRREIVRGRRELDAVLAGHHGASMRDEVLAAMARS